MLNEQNESELNDKKYSKKIINNYFEPAFFIAAITSSLYFFGYAYYVSFFSRLSIPFTLLDISTNQYIIVGLQPVLLLFGFFFASFIVWSKPPKNLVESFIGNILLYIFITIGIFHQGQLKNYLSLGVYIILLILIIRMTVQKKSFAYNFYKGDWNLRFMVLLIVLFGIIMFADYNGNNNAETLIEGSGKNSLEIQLMLKDNNSIQFQNKTLILIMLKNNNYYIVEKNETTPKDPKLYIIPSDKIDMAMISKINNN